jgi:hypothetical protein
MLNGEMSAKHPTPEDITPITQPSLRQTYRTLTGKLRMLPDFIVIGGQKCGTTFLYRYLSAHPTILPSTRKEVHFFDLNFSKGMNWYRSHFPLKFFKGGFFTGEASPAYLFYPYVPQRIKNVLPQVKLIALLRNPVDRAYSHYQHEVRWKRETLSFEEALAQESERIQGGLVNDQPTLAYHHFSYLKRGLYAEQIPYWLDVFPREQLLILRSEDLFENPAGIFREVLTFLRVPAWELPADYAIPNRSKGDPISPEVRRQLVDYFHSHNRRLYELLGRDFAWDR